MFLFFVIFLIFSGGLATSGHDLFGPNWPKAVLAYTGLAFTSQTIYWPKAVGIGSASPVQNGLAKSGLWW